LYATFVLGLPSLSSLNKDTPGIVVSRRISGAGDDEGGVGGIVAIAGDPRFLFGVEVKVDGFEVAILGEAGF
jgi:hypothetical protein